MLASVANKQHINGNGKGISIVSILRGSGRVEKEGPPLLCERVMALHFNFMVCQCSAEGNCFLCGYTACRERARERKTRTPNKTAVVAIEFVFTVK